ncbi:MAG: YhjD/YihY/BrkB family envelope integrity protein [Verrucomicrobiota bacterium]|nr:YihY family inner membrane protein [Limisphaera sp.]MDW8380642.1 YhjD/YihY/BrkB family envelope integrity protein [Verrucomicrobiota bacterium]
MTEHKPWREQFRPAWGRARAAWDDWGGRADRLEPVWLRCVRFCGRVVRGFNRNRGLVRAASLSYATLLSLVPLLALVLGVTGALLKGRSEEQIEAFVDRMVHAVVPPATPTNLPPEVQAQIWLSGLQVQWWAPALALDNQASATSEVATAGLKSGVERGTEKPGEFGAAGPSALRDLRRVVAQRLQAFIRQTRSAELGVTGSLGLLAMAILLLARVENTLNDIWGVPRGRPWFMRIVLYWSFLTLGPLLVIGAVALGSGPYWETPRAWLAQAPFLSGLVFRALPIILLWMVFAGLYKLVPNTRVEWSAAVVGGGFAAILWHLNNVLNVLYVSRVVTNFKIYGSLGLIPVFMLGLYVAWAIVLLGAQVAYTWQHGRLGGRGLPVEQLDQRGQELLALRLITLLGQAFQSGEGPRWVPRLAAEVGAAPSLCMNILERLRDAGLVLELAGPEPAYVPARPLESITMYDVLRPLRTGNGCLQPDEPDRSEEVVWAEYRRMQAAEKQVASAVTIRELVLRMQRRAELQEGRWYELTEPPQVVSVQAPSGLQRQGEQAELRESCASPQRPAHASSPKQQPQKLEDRTAPESEEGDFPL